MADQVDLSGGGGANASAGSVRGDQGTGSGVRSFMLRNKKWWLTPFIMIVLLAAALIFSSDSSLAPHLYALF